MGCNRSIGDITAEMAIRDIKFRQAQRAALAKLSDFSTGPVGGAVRIGARAATVAAVTAGAAVSAALVKAVSAASEREGQEAAFIPLLGSAEAAERRLEELAAFSAATPFELPEIVEASKALETLTRGALATGDGLELVGDLAAATARPFDELAVTVGRLYDGLQSGRPVGEAMARLQELGAISGDTRARIEQMQDQGAAGAEVWAVAEHDLERFTGSMAMQAGTWAGKISTLKDNVNLMFAELGGPLIDRLNPELARLNQVDLEAFGERLGDWIGTALQLFTDGMIWELFELKAAAMIERGKAPIEAALLTWLDRARNLDPFNPFSAEDRNEVSASFKGYQEAMKARAGSLIERFEDRADEIWNEAAARRSLVPDEPGPVPVAMVEDENARAAVEALDPSPAPEEADPLAEWQASDYEVNEMQRKGLGFGAELELEPGRKVSLYDEIRDILNRAKNERGSLVFRPN